MSNLLRTLRREAGTWVRDPNARRSNATRAERLQRARARSRRTAARRFATSSEIEWPLYAGPSTSAALTMLARLRAMFAPSASQRGR
jgi:hypothetical protein